MTEIIMPKAGMAMETGKIVKWLVSEGDTVKKGDMILEIETDKVNMEVEAFESGTILKLVADEGDEVPVTMVIGYLGSPGEKIPDAVEKTSETKVKTTAEPVAEVKKSVVSLRLNGTDIPATPAAKRLSEENSINIAQVTPSGHLGHVKAADVLRAKTLAQSGRIAATPLAKTLAEQRGIDIRSVKPSGHLGHVKAVDIPQKAAAKYKATPLAEAIAKDKGIDLAQLNIDERIYAKDVKAAMQEHTVKTVAASVPLMDSDTTEPLDAMRRVIAKRMLQSHTEVPPVTMHTKVNVTGLLKHRKKTNEQAAEKISINDYIIEACAKALAEMPEANISFGGDFVIRRGHVNIGVAVAIEGGGLIVPVIKDADKKNITELSAEMKTLAEKARTGKLMPDEYSGGTFTISNLGMMGITYFTPIINQPESMILGVNAIEKVLSMDEEGKLFNRDIMGLSLTFDHRAHDGAGAAKFLQRVVSLLERF